MTQNNSPASKLDNSNYTTQTDFAADASKLVQKGSLAKLDHIKPFFPISKPLNSRKVNNK